MDKQKASNTGANWKIPALKLGKGANGRTTWVNFEEVAMVLGRQKEDILKLYDLFYGCELVDKIFKIIPEDEISDITDWTYEAIDNIYDYRNSAAGIMEAVSRDYSNLELDADKIKGDIANPENLTLLKDVLTKLG